jgi:hypothetical protein
MHRPMARADFYASCSWGLDAERDWHNPGVLVVYLDGRQGMFSEPRAASWFSDDADGTGQVYMHT